ncbi:MAG: SPASM domain-containing protein [Peptococcaceae bacterium]|nr:SPASM domain-containing protein [Peptococcaceae bacterium]
MKRSKYTYIFDVDDTKVAFNGITCALAEIDEKFIRLYENIEEVTREDLNDEDKALLDDMLGGWFIVSDRVDELEHLKFRNLSGKYAQDHLSLIIAPTMACNFACPYCYENPKPGVLSRQVQDRLVEMVQENAERKRPVYVTWYGGEPLLAEEVVYDLSRRFIEVCEQNHVEYCAEMLTNGFLITDESIERFKECCISDVQITIDGSEAVHNRRRFLKETPSEGTFARILDNVKKIYHSGMTIDVRINLDKTNIADTKNLILYLKDLNMPEIGVVFGLVMAQTDVNQNIKDTCLTLAEYSEVTAELQEFLYLHGFNGSEDPFYPNVKKNYCGADSVNTFVVDPEGYLYKCWNEVGMIGDSIGNILGEGSESAMDMMARNVAYMTWSPFDNEGCRNCKVLPVCMGGCPYYPVKKGHKHCETWKFGFVETLKKSYKQRVETDVKA